ncbi:MAG: hypothetical protein ABF608_07235 [Sporolactobacillus sp.]
MKKLLQLITAAALSLGILTTGVAVTPQGIATTPHEIAYAKTASIKIVSFASHRTKGQWDTLRVEGAKHARATIAVYYNSGLSRSKFLNPTLTNGSGYASWTWKVGTRTAPGSYRVVVTVGGKAITTYLHVG